MSTYAEYPAEGGGGGDVVGPGAATDNAVARFDGTTGQLIQNSVVIVDDSGNTTGVGTLNTSGLATLGSAKISNLTTNGYVKTSGGDGTLGVQAAPIPVTDGGSGTITQFTLGSVVFAGASGVYTQDNASFFYDDTNDRLGLGTAAPSARLHILGTANITPASTGHVIRTAAATLTDTATAGSGTATTFVANSFGIPTLAATNSSVTTTTADTIRVNGAVSAGTNETLTTSNGLNIVTSNVAAGGGTVAKAVGLNVATPTGATANYTATFTGGFVGIGSATPTAVLQVGGSNFSGTPNSTGWTSYYNPSTFTDSNTAGSGTAANFVNVGYDRPALAATNALVTTTNADNIRVIGAVISAANQTIVNSTALRIVSAALTTGGGLVTNSYGLTVAAQTGGTNNYAASFTGNVGFGGVTDPMSPVSVAAQGVTVGTNEQIGLRSQRAAIVSGNMIGGISFRSNDTSLTAPGTIVGLMDAVAEATHTASVLDTGIAFQTTSTLTMSEKMRISAAGNVGIGTAAPGSLLTVNGTAALGIAGTTTGILNVNGSTSGTISVQPQAAAGTYNFNLPTSAGTSGQPLLSGGGAASAMTFGTLGVAAGGTGQTTYTDGQLLIGNTTGNTLTKAALTAGNGQYVTNGNGSITLAGYSYESTGLSNIGLAFSVAASALTIALKQADGSTDPASGSGACQIAFRSTTAGNGSYSLVSATAAASLVVTSGATLGHIDAVNGQIYVYAINNAGTVELAVSTRLFDTNAVVTTTTMSSSADDAMTIYSTTGRSNVACRLIAKLTSNQTTAGTWAAAPTAASLLQGVNTPMMGWIAYTPTVATTTGTMTNFTVVGYYNVVGDTLNGKIGLKFTGTPGTWTIPTYTLPSGFTGNTNAWPLFSDGRSQIVGVGQTTIAAVGTCQIGVRMLAANTTRVNSIALDSSGTYIQQTNMSETVPGTYASGDFINFEFCVPIFCW